MGQNAIARPSNPAADAQVKPAYTVYEMQRLSQRARSPIERRLTAIRTAKRRWALRRSRYGPTGRRPVDKRLASRLAGDPPGAWAIAYDPIVHAGSTG